MLPVNSHSNLSAQDFVDTIKQAKCLADWSKKIFSASGTDFRIAAHYTFPRAPKPPSWFQSWQMAAASAYQGNEWELTTGLLELLPKDHSIMRPDGVSIGKRDPDGGWVDEAQIGRNDSGEGGITVPTQSVKNDLNALKDAKEHYSGVIVSGNSRGAIVVVDRMKDVDGKVYPLSADEITETLFHELYHAGQISQGKPNADDDSRFNVITKAIKSSFSCTP